MMSTKSLFFFAILIVQLKSYPYYFFYEGPFTITSASQECKSVNVVAYLASTHSDEQSSKLTQIGLEHNSSCWVGLIIKQNHNNISFAWSDGTTVEMAQINSNWCEDYPHLEKVDHHSYTFIDGSCWKNTYNQSFVAHAICGPPMAGTTWYWISQCYEPMVLVILMFVYSLCIFIYLLRNYCCFEHNWIPEDKPSRINRCTALLVPLLVVIASIAGIPYTMVMIIGYKNTNILMPASFPQDQLYPDIYWIPCVCMYIAAGCLILAPLLTCTHALLRLKVFNNKNKYRKAVVPSYCFCIIPALIVILIPCVLVMIWSNTSQFIEDEKTRNMFVVCAVITFALGGFLINSLLLWYYVKGLYAFAKTHGDLNSKQWSTDEKVHELMLEAARYTVLFVTLIFCDMLFGILYFMERLLVYLVFWSQDEPTVITNEIQVMAGSIVYAIEIALILQIICLTPKFSHAIYEKIYGRCDKRMKKLATNDNRTCCCCLPNEQHHLQRALLSDQDL